MKNNFSNIVKGVFVDYQTTIRNGDGHKVGVAKCYGKITGSSSSQVIEVMCLYCNGKPINKIETVQKSMLTIVKS